MELCLITNMCNILLWDIRVVYQDVNLTIRIYIYIYIWSVWQCEKLFIDRVLYTMKIMLPKFCI